MSHIPATVKSDPPSGVSVLGVLGNESGMTPLHFAAQEVLPEMASLLIARGADVNRQDEEGNTPLQRAIFFARGRYEVVRLLRKAGAKDDLANRAGETPRQLAKRLGETVFTSN